MNKPPSQKILLSAGSGGKSMHKLIRGLLLEKLGNPILKELSDGAIIPYKEKLIFTTDSFVVSPLFFLGADIGRLSVCGTINDLLVMGAKPEFISLALIIEEGLDYSLLSRVIDSIAYECKKAGVWVTTGDLKVVEKGAADSLFINTAGIGRLISKDELGLNSIQPGDKIIITGTIADHGISVLSQRKGLDLRFNIKSDCASLNGLILPLFSKRNGIKFMRDPTRGGLATLLNEISLSRGLSIRIEEGRIPIVPKVRSACELLGIDPLYIGNEGKAVLVVHPQKAEGVVQRLRRHPLGRKARVIGELLNDRRGVVILKTVFGSERVVDMLTGEPLPRIC